MGNDTSSVNQGRVLTISSSAATTEEAEESQPEPTPEPLLFSPGRVVMTAPLATWWKSVNSTQRLC